MNYAKFQNVYNRVKEILFLGIRFSFAILIFNSCVKDPIIKPKAEKGIIDLRDWDFENKATTLDGEWEFYPDEFIDLQTAKLRTADSKKYIKTPGIWNESLGKRFGYASYRIVLLMPKTMNSSVVFKLAEMGTAYEMYVYGRKISGNGTVGKTRETSLPQLLPLITAEVNSGYEMEIILYISNFHNRDGGLWYSILLGTEKNIRNIREQKMLNSLFIYGCLFTMVLYHIAIFLIRNKDKSALIFSLFCVSVTGHLLVFDEKFLNQLFPNDNFLLLNRLEYLSYFFAAPLFSHFLYLVFPEDFNKIILRFIWAFTICISSIVILFGSEIYTFTILFFHIFTIGCMLYFLYVFTLAVKLKREGAKIIFFGTMVFCAGITNDILHSLIIVRTAFIFPQGLIIFLFCHSIVISIRFTNALTQVENLSASLLLINSELEEKVIQRTKEFKVQKEKAEEANEIKDKFVSIVSHDLRTPLQGVSNLLEILNNQDIKKSEEDQNRFLKMCRESIQFSLSMIRQLLDISRIETGALKVNKEEFPLSNLILSILEELKPLYSIKNISIDTNIAKSTLIHADKNLFQQVLHNLLVNSIKFSYLSHSIEIYSEHNEGKSLIKIKDHGVGMSEEKIKAIFSSPTVKSSIGTSGETGSGMGLYICKYILEAHNGSLSFESKVGEGTISTISLPIK